MMQDSSSSSSCSPSAPFTASNNHQRAPVTPQLWARELSRSGTVYYRTPSGRLLLHRDDLERYLAERASCRCGIRPGAEYVFNFSPEVEEKQRLDAFEAQASTSQASTPQVSTPQASTPQTSTPQAPTSKAQTPPTSPSQAQNTSPSATKRRSSEVVVEEEDKQKVVQNAEQVKAAKNDAQVEEVAGKQEEEEEGTKLAMANQSANWAPLVESDPTLLEWYCYSWTANLPTGDYHSLLRDLLDELADDSTTDLVEMYCILEGLPRKDLPVHPFPDDNFQAWLSQHDWGRLAVRRTTGHILPRQLSPHQLTHLLATTMLEEELEAQEERLQMVQTRQWAAAQRLKQLEVELKSRQQMQVQTEPENLKMDAEVLETDGDSEEEEEEEVEVEVELEDEDLTEESMDDEETGGGSDDSSEHESFVAVV